MNLSQVVPFASAQGEGVGGYAAALGEAMCKRGYCTDMLVPSEDAASARPGAGRNAAGLAAGALAAALDARNVEAVLLHYSGYGYARRGAPSWLARELEAWRLRSSRRRLVTVFHEVYANGPPWRSSFWLSPLQRRVAASLARRSDALWTSLEQYAELLRPWVDGRPVGVMPVFSTVGEPESVPKLLSRAARLVVFGGAGVRQRAYADLGSLARACRALEIDEIVDVGPTVESPDAVGGLSIDKRGSLPGSEISRLLLDSRAGYLCYEPRFLPKSTIFAAYSAHGVVPVCSPRAAPPGSELREDEHYWRPESAASRGEAGQEIADAAHGWYGGHSLELQADALRTMLE